MGPGTWVGAKKAIEDAPGNVIYATKTRTSPHEKKMTSTDWNTQPKGFGFSGCVGCYLSEIHTVISNSAIRCYCEFYCLASIINL